MRLSIKEMIRIAVGVTLIAVGAQIRVPSPVAGHFTLQLPVIIMLGIILGAKHGAFSVILYIVGGLLGIPWFASGGGLGYLASPSFGFLIAFIAAAFISGVGADPISPIKTIIFSEIAVVIVWLVGMIYMTAFNQVYLGKKVSYIASIITIFSIDLVVDILLAFIAARTGYSISRAVGR